MLGPSLRRGGGGGAGLSYAEKFRVHLPTSWAETIFGRNEFWPKRPTNIGRIDSPQNLVETTQAETTGGKPRNYHKIVLT